MFHIVSGINTSDSGLTLFKAGGLLASDCPGLNLGSGVYSVWTSGKLLNPWSSLAPLCVKW